MASGASAAAAAAAAGTPGNAARFDARALQAVQQLLPWLPSGLKGRGPPPAAAAGAAAAGTGGLGAATGGSSAAAGPPVQLVAVVAEAKASPLKGTPWGEVMRHMAQRLQWNNERFQLQVVSEDSLKSPAARDALTARLSSGAVPMFVAVGVSDPAVASFLAEATAPLKTALFWDSGGGLEAAHRVDGYAPATAGPLAQLAAKAIGWSREARAASVLGTVRELWGRHTSDGLLFTWLVVINEYVTTVPDVANTTKGSDLKSIQCMVKHCFKEIVACVSDPTCKAGLDCLQGCSFNDQVCQYRCITSHETKKFGAFGLCILQKHNCRNLNAVPPAMPDPKPMATFQGNPLSHESAEGIKRGWLGGPTPKGATKPWSWLIASGQNEAYDYFPCQHQLYYPKGSAFWYEPVFKVITLQGDAVWRRRRYRVKRGSTPGTFHYSVSDNGITSNEYWRILDAADDLSFAVFFYTGAAARAGLAYSGAVIGTPDGAWPAAHTERIEKALDRAGIKLWELSAANNADCAGAPLELAA